MYQENSITITPVSNGFCVMLPFNHEQENPMPIDLSQVSNFIKGFKKEMLGEDILEEIKNKSKEEAKEILKSIKPPMPKSEHIFIFKTFAEVLDFLKEQVI